MLLGKLFWILAALLYGAAVVVAITAEAAGLDYRVWLLVGLGTLSAVLGNTVHITDWEQERAGTPPRG